MPALNQGFTLRTLVARAWRLQYSGGKGSGGSSSKRHSTDVGAWTRRISEMPRKAIMSPKRRTSDVHLDNMQHTPLQLARAAARAHLRVQGVARCPGPDCGRRALGGQRIRRRHVDAAARHVRQRRLVQEGPTEGGNTPHASRLAASFRPKEACLRQGGGGCDTHQNQLGKQNTTGSASSHGGLRI